jgi:hypothetical protein
VPICALTYRDIIEMIRDDYLNRPVIPAARQASAPHGAWDSGARQDAPRKDTARTGHRASGGRAGGRLVEDRAQEEEGMLDG